MLKLTASWRSFLLLAIVCSIHLFVFSVAWAQKFKRISVAACTSYEGRYAMPDVSVLLISKRDGGLTARPIFWRSVQELESDGTDSFVVPDRRSRKLIFERDARGCVTAVKLTGFGDGDGTFPRLGPELTAAELLMNGQPRAAALKLAGQHPKDEKPFTSLARSVVENFASHSLAAVAFVQTALQFFPRSAVLHATLGDAYISAGQRGPAKESYIRAYNLDHGNSWALRALERLNASPLPAKTGGWTVPFPLDRLFAPPTPVEIKQVWANWAKRDLKPTEVKEVAHGKVTVGTLTAQVRVLAYRIHGQLNYGAILVPDGLPAGPAPVIMDLKGVSPDFFPLDLEHLSSPWMLGDDNRRFIYFIPSFRGERLIFNGQTFQSEGDPTDSWDGAADDSLAFLTAALVATPQADASRIVSFGKSRGGALALLTGLRDPRIARVVAWSAPVDFFQAMGAHGWSPREVAGDALRYRAEPKEDGGQFVATFLAQAIAGKRGLEEVRMHMIASSALYFADHLPRTQIHQGVEDEMVGVANGRSLSAAFRRLRRSPATFQVILHPGAGHDLYKPVAWQRSREFIMARLWPGQ